MARRRRRSKAWNVTVCTLVLIVCCGLPWLLPGCRFDTAPLCAKSHDVAPRTDEDAGNEDEDDAGPFNALGGELYRDHLPTTSPLSQ